MTFDDTLLPDNNDTSWALLPSDPAIFNDMIQQYGVKQAKVEEVFTLDFEELKKNGSVHGLMFISRYVEEELPEDIGRQDPDADDIIFTAQVITNVCGTLALLSILLNANVTKGTILDNFLSFTDGFSPVNRGLCLGNSKEIRTIHDAYATNANHFAEIALNDAAALAEDGNAEYMDADSFHYVSYIFKNGFIWELDGLKCNPIKLKESTEEEWLDELKDVLLKKIEMSQDISISMLAVTADKEQQQEQQQEQQEQEQEQEQQQQQQEEEDVCRQKHNYFPFLRLLMKRGLEKNLVPVTKKRKREDDDDVKDEKKEAKPRKIKKPKKITKK